MHWLNACRHFEGTSFMIWSLAKIIIFIVGVAALALGAGWLLESEGGVRIIVAGMEITLGPLQSVIALIVMVLVIWLGLKLLGLLIACWKFLNGDDTALSRYFAETRRPKALMR
jgi:HemY protein